MSAEQEPVKARIQVEVYRASDGFRWRIASSKRGRRILADSGQGYMNKADVFRGLLLVTGGRYERRYHHRGLGVVYEQGYILRPLDWVQPNGPDEAIFVEYSTGEVTP